MKKYRLKIDFGEHKTGSEFKYKANSDYKDREYSQCRSYSDATYYILREDNSNIAIEFHESQAPLLIEQGIIEEVPEKEWTDSDMIEFLQFYIDNFKVRATEIHPHIKNRGNYEKRKITEKGRR
jgi:hypothetical protein